MNARYGHIIEAAKTNLVPDKERTQYLRAMLSDYDKKDIAEAYFEEGMEKGEIKRSREIALAMLADSMDIALVAKYSGLSVEEVEALKG